jgi:tetratricopeptide (TPR) repeat protein
MDAGLIIDSQRNQHKTLRPALELALGKEPDSSYTLVEARQLLLAKIYDYIIIDPSTDTFPVCLNFLLNQKHENNIKPFCTILICASESSPQFVTACADLEPDDIVLKPIKVSELIARLTLSLEKKHILKIPLLEWERTGRVIETYKAFERSGKTAKTTAQQKQILRAQATFYTQQKKHTLAMQVLNRLRGISDTPNTHLLIAHTLMASGQETKAIEILEHVLSNHPKLLPGYDLLAEARYLKGDGPNALRARAIANDLNPLNSTRAGKLSEEAFNLGDMALAQRTLEFQIQNLPVAEKSRERFALLSQVLLAQNKIDEGIKALVLASEIEGDESPADPPQIILARLRAAFTQNKRPEALSLLHHLQNIDEQSLGPKPYLAEAALWAYELDEIDIADQWLKRVLLRQSLSFSQYQKTKDAMTRLNLANNLTQIAKSSAQIRATHAQRSTQFREAGMFMEIAQDMIEYTEHPDADTDSLIETLEAIAEADQHGQIHQAANLVIDMLHSRVHALTPTPSQEKRLALALGRITSINR